MLGNYIIIVLSILLFFQAFFPVSKFDQHDKVFPPSKIDDIFLNKSSLYASEYTKTVLIIIDAMRLDFVKEELMPEVSRLIQKNGCLSTVKVESPTVTLPRIKALTSGNVPQFIDLVYNLVQNEALSDSIIHSAVEDNRRVVFYGDDTWVKLFPKKFSRYEGTTSFFVKDFFEVDDNVTRNVYLELNRVDWDILILHYLGLDHIGHVFGPRSSLIPTKLSEMDEIVSIIHNHFEKTNEKVLLLITGDHGMKDSGGHGGSTYAEVTVPLIAIGLNCTEGTLLQTDMPVNLAAMLGLRIPSTSIGQIKTHLFKNISLEKHLYLLYYNIVNLLQKSKICNEIFKNATELHKLYLKDSNEDVAQKAIRLYESCSQMIAETLVSESVQQNVPVLLFTNLLILLTIIVLFKKIINMQTIILCPSIIIIVILLIVLYIPLPHLVINLLSLFVILLIAINLFKFDFQWLPKEINLDYFIIISLLIIHPITFFSSSYVEEEQQYWYFTSQLVIILGIVKAFNDDGLTNNIIYILSPLGFRFLITLNQTGDKWANLPDLVDWFQKSENIIYFHMFYISSMLVLGFSVIKLSTNTITKSICVVSLILIFILKQGNNENIYLGRSIWLLIIVNIILDKPVISWLLICALLFKKENIYILPHFLLTTHLFNKVFSDNNLKIFAHLSLANALYFAQGHSNSLASVDISIGYIGLSHYQPLMVFFQVLCHTFAMPVLAHITLVSQNKDCDKLWNIFLLHRLYINLLANLVTFFHRNHIFIWSVFSPKLFIELITSVFLLCEIVVYKLVCNYKFCLEKFLLYVT